MFNSIWDNKDRYEILKDRDAVSSIIVVKVCVFFCQENVIVLGSILLKHKNIQIKI